MKDKLVKTNHKKIYYRIKTTSIFLVASVTLIAVLGVPTYVFVQNKVEEITEAMEKEQEKLQQEEQSKNEINLLSY